MDVPPSQTVYVNNLYEKLPKEELKKCLYAIFSQFGKVLEVVALKTQRLRGQAWVVFSDVAAATNALRTLQGFPFFEKPIRISYAKTKSDAIAKLDGSFNPRKKKSDKGAAKEPQKREKTAPARAAAGASTAAAGGADGAAAPNKILFVQNLPRATTDMMLGMLFQQFPGFREVRMVEARPGIAFVEFENEVQAGVALSGLNGFKITPENAMQVTYGKQ